MSIDITQLLMFFERDSLYVVLDFFALGGWLIIAWLLSFAFLELYTSYRQDKYKADWQPILLAIDIPAINIQTPKAVEQMFAHLAGAYENINLYEKYIEGIKQRVFSLEIISIEGYIQFLIWTEEKFRELVETSIYAQYPDAEIIEVEDYTNGISTSFPNNEFEVWASDFSLAENDAYPIRSYREFEHAISKDTVLKDPMGTFLESFTRIGRGEQMWFQIIIEPISNSWKEKAIAEIKNLIGEKKKVEKNIGDYATDTIMKSLETFGDQILGREPSEIKEQKKDDEPNKLRYLTPGQGKLVEAMEEKISKIGFKTKIRAVYLARKEVFRKSRGVNALVGAINQYNIPSANSIVPSYSIDAYYFLKKMRQRYRKELLVDAFKKRKHKAGASPYILNIEELATIWHFPMSHVKTPLVQKAEGKHVEPPIGLPAEIIEGVHFDAPSLQKKKPNTTQKAGYKTDSGDIRYDDGFRFG